MTDIMFNSTNAKAVEVLPNFTFSKDYLNAVSIYYFNKLGSFWKIRAAHYGMHCCSD